MLPTHEYGCIQYTNYYTDTMGTLRRNHMERSIFMWERWRKRLTSFQLQTQSARELLPCAFISECYIWNVCAEGGGGFLIGSNTQTAPPHTHTKHTHLSHQPGNSPVSCHCGLWVAKQRGLSLRSIVESHLYCCGVCSWGDGAELSQLRSRTLSNAFESLWCVWHLFQRHHQPWKPSRIRRILFSTLNHLLRPNSCFVISAHSHIILSSRHGFQTDEVVGVKEQSMTEELILHLQG